MGEGLDFDDLVARYYEPLYQFAFSLTHSAADAADLTQQVFLTWARKGTQLRDQSKVKSWLFTALHRRFLERRRHETRFHHQELSEADSELPMVSPPAGEGLDTEKVLAALGTLDEIFRAPVVLFYLEDYAYQEIAEILEVPLGTVKSRIARGVRQLQARLAVGSVTPIKPNPLSRE
jgi:RNA polymerase sigma-70 factor (ECF subfamily)